MIKAELPALTKTKFAFSWTVKFLRFPESGTYPAPKQFRPTAGLPLPPELDRPRTLLPSSRASSAPRSFFRPPQEC